MSGSHKIFTILNQVVDLLSLLVHSFVFQPTAWHANSFVLFNNVVFLERKDALVRMMFSLIESDFLLLLLFISFRLLSPNYMQAHFVVLFV